MNCTPVALAPEAADTGLSAKLIFETVAPVKMCRFVFWFPASTKSMPTAERERFSGLIAVGDCQTPVVKPPDYDTVYKVMLYKAIM